jgi:uncharacterized membrane protein
MNHSFQRGIVKLGVAFIGTGLVIFGMSFFSGRGINFVAPVLNTIIFLCLWRYLVIDQRKQKVKEKQGLEKKEAEDGN